MVLATTVSAEVCTEAEILQAYQEQHTLSLRGADNPSSRSHPLRFSSDTENSDSI